MCFIWYSFRVIVFILVFKTGEFTNIHIFNTNISAPELYKLSPVSCAATTCHRFSLRKVGK